MPGPFTITTRTPVPGIAGSGFGGESPPTVTKEAFPTVNGVGDRLSEIATAHGVTNHAVIWAFCADIPARVIDRSPLRCPDGTTITVEPRSADDLYADLPRESALALVARMDADPVRPGRSFTDSEICAAWNAVHGSTRTEEVV